MKSLKRVLAIALTLMMIVSALPMVSAFDDVQSTDVYAEAIEVLSSLKLLLGDKDSNNFRPEATITRAEVATIICRLMGVADMSSVQSDTQFSDVSASHWASGYIKTANQYGIIVGYPEGNFLPEAPVKYEEVIKMLVCALGYEVEAAETGYPTGYLAVASRNSITTGVPGGTGAEAPRGTVAMLVYNSLDVPLMQRSTFGTGAQEFTIYDGSNNTARRTLMSEYLNMVRVEGTVEANAASKGSTLDGKVEILVTDNDGSRLSKDNRKYTIGTTHPFNVGETGIKDLLGYPVVVYVQHETSSSIDPTVLAVLKDLTNQGEITLNGEDIEAVNISGNGLQIEYFANPNDTRTTKFTVGTSANRLFWNGVVANLKGLGTAPTAAAIATAMKAYLEDFVANEFGTVRFVNTDTRSGFDYNQVFVSSYKIMVVDEVNTVNTRIVNKTEGVSGSCNFVLDTITYDPADKGIYVTITDKDGVAIDPADLKEWDVLTVRYVDANKNTTYPSTFLDITTDRITYSAVLTNEIVEGAVTEVDNSGSDGNGYKVDYTIGGNVYRLSTSVALSNDSEGFFYIDALGKIAAYKRDTSARRSYAIILDAYNGSSMDPSRVKMLTTDGRISTYDVASRLRVNNAGATAAAAEDIENIVSVGELIAFGVNSSNQISSVDTAFGFDSAKAMVPYRPLTTSTPAVPSGVRDNTPTGDTAKVFINAWETGGEYFKTASTRRISGNVGYTLNADTIIFVVPTGGDPDKFSVYLPDAIDDGQSFTGVIEYYNATSSRPEIVVIRDSIVPLNPSTGVAFIDSISTATNTSGTAVSRYRVYGNNGIDDPVAPRQHFESEDGMYIEPSPAPAITKGAVAIPTFNALGEIDNMYVLVEMATRGVGSSVYFVPEETTELVARATVGGPRKSTDVNYVFGKVTGLDGFTVTVDNVLPSGSGIMEVGSRASVYVYDQTLSSSNNVRAGESVRYMSFQRDSSIPFDDNIEEYYILIREVNGVASDAFVYVIPKR